MAGPAEWLSERHMPPLSLAALEEIRDECLADDLPILESMSLWSEERVRTYFEDGGHDPELSAQPPSPPSPTPLPSAPPPPAPPPAPPPPQHRVGGSMYGMQLAECERLSTAVVVVRGLNPGFFTGPGTNTYIVGTAAERVLIDAGDHGRADYVQLLGRALRNHCGGARLSAVLVTHAHPDHVGGVRGVVAAHGAASGCAVRKVSWRGRGMGLDVTEVADGDVVRVDGATTLRALYMPGHAPDHVCWLLEEESALTALRRKCTTSLRQEPTRSPTPKAHHIPTPRAHPQPYAESTPHPYAKSPPAALRRKHTTSLRQEPTRSPTPKAHPQPYPRALWPVRPKPRPKPRPSSSPTA